MIFSFITAGRIVFGRGAVKDIGRELFSFGRKAFLVTGNRSIERYGITERLINLLQSAGIGVVLFSKVEQEPGVDRVRKGLKDLKMHKCDLVPDGSDPNYRREAEAAILRIEELNRRFGMLRKLGELGLVERDIDWIADESLPSGSLKANLREVKKREDLMEILRMNLR